jgi:predicted transposase/invertase (TIGR01784 family)
MVEVQTTEQAAFGDRMTYYNSRTFSRQLLSGNTYTMLKRVIGIAITTFLMFRRLRGIHNTFLLKAKADPNVVLTDRMQMHTLEVAEEKIHLVNELPPALAAWVNFFYFSHQISEDEMTTLLKDQPMVQRAYEKYKQFNQDETLRALDESRERFLHDYATDIEVSMVKGEAIGVVKGEIRATLKQRFHEVPQEIRDAIQSMTDLVAMQSLLAHAENCMSLDEFAEALK